MKRGVSRSEARKDSCNKAWHIKKEAYKESLKVGGADD